MFSFVRQNLGFLGIIRDSRGSFGILRDHLGFLGIIGDFRDCTMEDQPTVLREYIWSFFQASTKLIKDLDWASKTCPVKRRVDHYLGVF